MALDIEGMLTIPFTQPFGAAQKLLQFLHFGNHACAQLVHGLVGGCQWVPAFSIPPPP